MNERVGETGEKEEKRGRKSERKGGGLTKRDIMIEC